MIAVFVGGRAPNTRKHGGFRELAETHKLLGDDRSLDPQLLGIGNVLPVAAAAAAEVWADGRHARRSVGMARNDLAACKAALALDQLHAHFFAGQTKRHKNHHARVLAARVLAARIAANRFARRRHARQGQID